MTPLLSAFEAAVAVRPDHLAACDQSLMLRYAELRAVAMGLARRIVEGTGRPHVGILAPTSAVGAAAVLACWYAGRVPVPLNFLLAAEELAGVIRDAELDLVLTVERFAPQVAALGGVVGGLTPLVMDAKSVVPGKIDPPTRGDDDLAVLLYTSGTQGRPKGVRLTQRNLMSNARAAIDWARLGPDEVFISILPQFHCFGLTAMTIVPLVLGATTYYLPRFTPLALLETMQTRGGTVFMAVASIYAALLAQKAAERVHFASLRLAISGGEPLPHNVYDAFRERFGVTIYEGYGLTEASPIVAWNTPEHHRPGSVGRTLPGIEAFAVEGTAAAGFATGGQPQRLGPGQTGELCLRGHCVMEGYHGQPEATAAVLRGGTLATGDVGHVDAEGYVYITGRAKEMIIVGGENVYPREIENVLLQHPQVAEAAAIGVRDPLRGEQPVAFVILKPEGSATDIELRSFCREKLAGYKIPRQVIVAEDLPRGPTGKILKRALSERLPSEPT